MKFNNTCKACTKIIEVESVPTSENYCHDCTSHPELVKDRLELFIKKDSYVKFLFNDLKSNGHSPDQALEILNGIILEDASLLNSYKML